MRPPDASFGSRQKVLLLEAPARLLERLVLSYILSCSQMFFLFSGKDVWGENNATIEEY